jgi:hypothetical protein
VRKAGFDCEILRLGFAETAFQYDDYTNHEIKMSLIIKRHVMKMNKGVDL